MSRSKNRSNLVCRNGWWSFRVQVDGKVNWVSLGTQDETIAREAAESLRRNIQAERLRVRLEGAGIKTTVTGEAGVIERHKQLFDRLGTMRRSEDFATIAEIDAAFRADAVGRAIKEKSVSAYLSYLRRIVRIVHDVDESKCGTLRASVLTWQLLHDFQARELAAAKPLGELAIEKALTTSFSAINQARAVFSDDARRGAEMRKLRLPDLTEFLEFKPQGSTRKVRVEIDDATLRRLRHESDDLWFSAPARWLAFALCGGIGLRRGEAARARWDWVRQVGGKFVVYLVTTAEGGVKGNEHKKEIDPSLWADMCAVRQAGDYIIPGETEDARQAVLDANVRWLRAFGLAVDKPNHELRAIYLQALDRAHGRTAAQLGAGHGDARTTEIYTGRGTAPAVRPM